MAAAAAAASAAAAAAAAAAEFFSACGRHGKKVEIFLKISTNVKKYQKSSIRKKTTKKHRFYMILEELPIFGRRSRILHDKLLKIDPFSALYYQ